MKLFATIIALSLAGAIVTPAIAAEYPMTKADCEKAGLKWKEEKHKCKPSVRVVNWSPAKRLWAWIGLGFAVVGLTVCAVTGVPRAIVVGVPEPRREFLRLVYVV